MGTVGGEIKGQTGTRSVLEITFFEKAELSIVLFFIMNKTLEHKVLIGFIVGIIGNSAGL